MDYRKFATDTINALYEGCGFKEGGEVSYKITLTPTTTEIQFALKKKTSLTSEPWARFCARLRKRYPASCPGKSWGRLVRPYDAAREAAASAPAPVATTTRVDEDGREYVI
jgi:hypothetical protein